MTTIKSVEFIAVEARVRQNARRLLRRMNVRLTTAHAAMTTETLVENALMAESSIADFRDMAADAHAERGSIEWLLGAETFIGCAVGA